VDQCARRRDDSELNGIFFTEVKCLIKEQVIIHGISGLINPTSLASGYGMVVFIVVNKKCLLLFSCTLYSRQACSKWGNIADV